MRRGGYESERPEVQALAPREARRILDIGCSAGGLGAALKRRQGAEVVGIELDEDYARDAEAVLDRVLLGDVQEVLAEPPEDIGAFDLVIAADVLEHLVDPWTALRRATDLLEPGGTAIVSLPNVRYLAVFWTLAVRGRWPRHAAGLFDATHLRWFTPKDARDLLEQAGLEVERVEPRYWVDGWALRLFRTLARTPLAPFLAGQLVLVGRKRG
jgi:2-polyprenyl-3-methyl-5-hydroxy-6-metoxy-1,4-benzoquinol methylase